MHARGGRDRQRSLHRSRAPAPGSRQWCVMLGSLQTARETLRGSGSRSSPRGPGSPTSIGAKASATGVRRRCRRSRSAACPGLLRRDAAPAHRRGRRRRDDAAHHPRPSAAAAAGGARLRAAPRVDRGRERSRAVDVGAPRRGQRRLRGRGRRGSIRRASCSTRCRAISSPATTPRPPRCGPAASRSVASSAAATTTPRTPTSTRSCPAPACPSGRGSPRQRVGRRPALAVRRALAPPHVPFRAGGSSAICASSSSTGILPAASTSPWAATWSRQPGSGCRLRRGRRRSDASGLPARRPVRPVDAAPLSRGGAVRVPPRSGPAPTSCWRCTAIWASRCSRNGWWSPSPTGASARICSTPTPNGCCTIRPPLADRRRHGLGHRLRRPARRGLIVSAHEQRPDIGAGRRRGRGAT